MIGPVDNDRVVSLASIFESLQMLADPESLLLDGGNHVLSKEEQSRRERVREVGSGIVSYSSSNESPNIAFTSAGSLFTANLETNVISNRIICIIRSHNQLDCDSHAFRESPWTVWIWNHSLALFYLGG